MSKESIMSIEKEYLKQRDWEVKENANVSRSYSSFIGYTFNKLVNREKVLSSYLSSNVVKMHLRGDIYIHKLPHSLWIPYCVGWNYGRVLRMGLITPTIYSKPAKHLSSASSHLVNFLYMASQEWTGAQAVSAIDLFLAPFIRHDRLKFREIKQDIQKLIFELNYPSRLGFQAVFTNITIMLDLSKHYLEEAAIVDGRKVGILGDYIDEALQIARAIIELKIEGDGLGRPMTFPISTIMVTKDFDWSGRRWGSLSELIFKAMALKGSLYVLNGYHRGIDFTYAMCCRLTLDTSRLHEALIWNHEVERARGVWTFPDATGSIGVVTINLPRIAGLVKGDWDKFEEILDERLNIARTILLSLRKRYERILEEGLIPMTKTYLGHFRNHFNTIGVIGLPETSANLALNNDLWINCESKEIKDAIKLEKNIVTYIVSRVKEFEEYDGIPYNVEEVPAESAAYKLALKDYVLFKELIKKGSFFIPVENGRPFYSNSIVPYYAEIPLLERAKLEGEVQELFTGGVMAHFFLYESPDSEALKKLVYHLVTKTKLIYFSITPVISTCTQCPWNCVGLFDKCLVCGGDVEVWSRIVGYYRPLRMWHEGRVAEFMSRVHYGGKGKIKVRGFGRFKKSDN